MNTDAINKAFEELISTRAIHTKLGISSDSVRDYRKRLNQGENIKTETKLKLLQKSGWRQDQVKYTLEDLVSLLNFYKSTSQAARDMGPEYVIEKWEAKR